MQGGAAEAKKAKQWTRVPMQVTTVYNLTQSVPLPPGDPRMDRKKATNYLYLMPEANAPHNYGLTAPFTVRTVAFGSIPVTATLRMAQRRDAAGLPIPLVVTNYDDYYRSGTQPPDWPAWAGTRFYEDTEVAEQLDVLVQAVIVDGVDLGLRPGCKTVEMATLALHGAGFISRDPTVNELKPWLSGHYAPAAGGLLSGTVDVPAFASCVTESGEDVSALLTATVSGPDNGVALHANSPFVPCTHTNLPQVGEYDAAATCPDAIPGHVNLPRSDPDRPPASTTRREHVIETANPRRSHRR
ncbi:hypothetical protein [Nocardioides alcanivorans]|uniref:hypothetical protein n=1 Tax=Nocardioides alcanivorans TaxID=2897352 RepID=UPI001F1BDA31|nr:hypothetical protein [Nocardioides alcanivorans]